jgi:hypothetical protein
VDAIIDAGVDELTPIVGRKAACAALGRSRATHYRARRPPRCGPPAPRHSHRRLSDDEQESVVGTLNAERFCDKAPAQVWPPCWTKGPTWPPSPPCTACCGNGPRSESAGPRLHHCRTTIASARSFCNRFFEYYNHEHRHSGIGLHTPADVHFGMAEVVREKRQDVLDAAYSNMPGRFRRPPQAPRIPEVFWINRPEEAPIAI